MVLDSVWDKNTNNQIMAEVSLMRAALLGDPVVLSPNQAMDSLALQEIVLSNNRDGRKKNAFCQAVELGIVKVAMPRGNRDLIAYCLSSLNRGLLDPTAEFVISGLHFLYQKDEVGNDIYPYSRRCEITRSLIECFENGQRATTSLLLPVWLSSEEKNMIENYVESVALLNKSIETYNDFVSFKNYFPMVLEKLIWNRLKEEEPKTEMAFILQTMQAECVKKGASVYRSYYYKLIEEMDKRGYSHERLSEVKAIIDIAYNRVMVASVREGSEESISPDLSGLCDFIIETDKPKYAFQSSYTVEADVSCLNWEMIIWVYDEVQAIMENEGLGWESAIEKLYDRERSLPFKMGGKYLVYTSLKVAISSFIPGGAIVNFIQEVIDDTVGDAVGNKVPGSPGEVKERSKQARDVKTMLDTIIYTEQRSDGRGRCGA